MDWIDSADDLRLMCRCDSEDTAMNTFKEKDRVSVRYTNLDHSLQKCSGTVYRVVDRYIYITRDDNGKSWIAYDYQCSFLAEDNDCSATPIAATPAEKKGYEPDGFNPEAFRDFMKENFR